MLINIISFSEQSFQNDQEMSDFELMDYSPSSAESSGYGSGQESPKHNNNFKTEPPPVLNKDLLSDSNLMTNDDDPNTFDLNPVNRFDDIESIDSDSSLNELYGNNNKYRQELDDDSMDLDDGAMDRFLKALRELDDVDVLDVPFEADATNGRYLIY